MITKNPPKITNRNLLVKYVEVDLWNWLKEVSRNLQRLTFGQNFQSFTVENLSIPATTEVAIYNQFKTSFPGNIPTARIIIRQKGDANIIDGVNAWTAETVFLRNPSANDAVVSVIFFI